MQRPQVRMVQAQTEEVTGERQLTEEETKEFLFKNHPELYKKMYPDLIIPKKVESGPIEQQPRINQDVQKSNNTYVYDEYKSAQISDNTDFSYKIEIKTDMKINR